MAPRQDILIDVIDSDIKFVFSDTQHVEDTINAAPGWWKENPSDGVNIRAYLNSDGQAQVLARSIQVNLQSDLYLCSPVVNFDSNGKLLINPNAVLS